MTHRWLVGAVATVLFMTGLAAQTSSQGQLPEGELVLGTINIPRAVLADGKPLAAGRYTVRLTPDVVDEAPPGQLPRLERWVEFVRNGKVAGRELASIVPSGDEKELMEGPDRPGRVGRSGSRVEMLKGGEFLRIWIARNGDNFLIHLPPQAAP